jgi:hypothetical protein
MGLWERSRWGGGEVGDAWWFWGILSLGVSRPSRPLVWPSGRVFEVLGAETLMDKAGPSDDSSGLSNEGASFIPRGIEASRWALSVR